MTWQDELRQLDEKLASGLISADDYRRGRDALLAVAANPTTSGGSDPGPPTAGSGQSPSAENTQLIQPIAPPPPPGSGLPSDSDRTQAVAQGWTQQPSYQQPPPMQAPPMQPPPRPSSDADRTQVVPNVGASQASPPGGFPQQTPWGRPNDESFSSPHWSGPELPAAPWTNNEPWVKQGPEVFEDDGRSTGKIVAIVVAVVLLIGIGVGAYLIWGGSSTDNTAGGQTSSAPPTPTRTTPPKIVNPMSIVDLPGRQTDQKVKDFAGVSKIDYLTPEEIAAYQAGQSGESGMVIGQLPDNVARAVVLVVKPASAELATATAKKLVDIQIGYKATEVPGMSANVKVTQVADVIRAHYVSNGIIVRIEVKATDPSQRSGTFQDLLQAQLKALPANA